MNTTVRLAAIGLLAAVASAPLLAGDHASRTRSAGGFDHGMQLVVNRAAPGEPGHGWRYFSDTAAVRAVVISPQGEYYYSRGKGLNLVAVTQAAA